jgi:spore photoproduct lyase
MKYVERKATIIRPSGRSSDYITPSFGYGCVYKCNYCYMRRHVPNGLTIAKNTAYLIQAIDDHVAQLPFPKIPNQTHAKYYTYDFSCNEDYIKHARFHDWEQLFDYFRMSNLAMGTGATKYVNHKLLKYNPERKVRIRYSLMPQHLSDVLEPSTSKIIDRIKAIDMFYDAGYDVHINYSPIILHKNWHKSYKELFQLVDKHVKNKDHVLAECIFLTHNEKMHEYNISNNIKGENFLWYPQIQESKKSQYGGKNIRYKWSLKQECIDEFKHLHNHYIPWNKIRYIF